MMRRFLFLAVLTFLAVTTAYQVPVVYDPDTPGVVLEGFHALEGHGANAFRWTDGNAHIHISGAGTAAWKLMLNLSGSRPAGVEPPVARLLVNGVPVAAFKSTRATTRYDYALPWPQPLADDIDVQIASDTFAPPNDLRTLGVGVYALRIEPAEPFTVPSARVVMFSMVAVIAIAASANRTVKLVSSTVDGSQSRKERITAWGIPLFLLPVIVIGLVIFRVLTAVALPWLAGAAVVIYTAVRLHERASRLETAAIIATSLSFLHFCYDFLDLFRISRFTDVATMFQAAQKLVQGLDPYDYVIVRDNPLYAHSYVYPPSFAQFLGLFLPFGTPGATYAWVGLNCLLYFVVLAGLLRVFNLHVRSAGMYALLLVAFNYQPVIDTLYGGQLDILILALLVLALLLARRERFVASGAALAFAVMTKLHPALVLPFYCAPRRWRGYLGFALALALIVAVSVALAPPNLYVSYLTVVLPGRGGESTGNPENQSLSGFLYRVQNLSWDDQPSPAQAASTRYISYGASALLGLGTLGAMLYSLYRVRNNRSNANDALHHSLWIVLMLLVLPTSWVHYETQLLLPLAAILPYALAARRRGLLIAWAVVAALTAFANQEIFRSGDFDAFPLILLQSYKLYGVLLLWALLLWLTLKPHTLVQLSNGHSRVAYD
jgi:hypothetical protein